MPYYSRTTQHMLKSVKYNNLVKEVRHVSGMKSRVTAVEDRAGEFVATSV